MPPPLTVAVLDKGNKVSKITDISPCLMSRDYKGWAKKAEAIAVIECKEEDLEADICRESGLMNPDGCGKTLRVGGGVEA